MRLNYEWKFEGYRALQPTVIGDDAILLPTPMSERTRVWKDGRYGKGRSLLLESTDQILIAAEDGRVVLLEADATAHKETASFQALKGKTWNDPVVVGDKLLVRNRSEAACYALPAAP